MKKTIILASILLGFVACTSDEEIYVYQPDPKEVLLGKWKLTSMEGQTAFDFNGDGEETKDLMIETNCYQDEFMEFFLNDTGKVISNSYAEITVFPDFPASEPASIDCVEEFEETPFQYTISGNQISFMELDSTVYTGTLTGNEIMITLPQGQIYFDDEFNAILTEDLVLKYTKVE